MANEIFTGNSRYSSDFQQVIDRSVAIASLPLSQLKTQRVKITDQQSAISGLQGKFNSVQSAIKTIEAATGAGSYSAAAGDSAIARASVTTGAISGTYSLEVISLGSKTATSSLDTLPKVTDPATQSFSASTSLTLTINGTDHTIEPESNNLLSLVDAINSDVALGVQATIVNLGSTATPDYRLSIQGNSRNADTIQLNDGTDDLLTTLSTGSKASYRINGLPAAPIETESLDVTLSTGLKVTLAGTGTTSVTVSRNAVGISNALGTLVTAYNAALDEVDGHRGESKSVLAGQSILSTLSNSLRDALSHTATSGTVRSFADLGVTFGDDGRLQFDSSKVIGGSDGDFANLASFLGSTSTGGFLKVADDAIGAVVETEDSLLPSELDTLSENLVDHDARISANETRVELVRETLTKRIAATDALIATLEQEVKYMEGLFEAMRASNDQN